MKKISLPPMHELCLMHARVDRDLRSVVSKQLEPFNITVMEWLVLGVLSTAPKNGLSMSSISIELDVTLPQVTALVTNLTEHKFTKQKVLLSDRRGRQVMLTLKGRRTVVKLEGIVTPIIRQWSKDIEIEQFRLYLDTVNMLAGRAQI